DQDQSSGPVIRNLLDSLEFNGDYSTTLPYGFLTLYKSIFVCAGIYPNNYIIKDTSRAGHEIDFYLQSQNGKAYVEGGDVWYDPLSNHGYNFGPLFGIHCQYNSIGLFPGVTGISGTFTQNMAFEYGGATTMIDYIDSTGGSELIFRNAHNNYGCGVAAGNRTVGLSFELGGLVDTLAPSTRLALIDSIMDYFGVPPTSIKEFQAVDFTPVISLSCHPNPFRQMTDIRYLISAIGDQQPELRIYDVAGRLVRDFSEQLSVIGHPSSVKWDGYDDLGRKLAQGVYFVHLQAAGLEKVTKAILLQ
ncbi:T9SS type A sorting domain-containing protein, partial [candidate division WOR-3 bacterium]|nr:T9SS type A sorting domain-containing protein [candidate division WOR-3 bacterium]